MTPSRIEAATFRFVAQRLNHCATAVAVVNVDGWYYLEPKSMKFKAEGVEGGDSCDYSLIVSCS